MHPQRFVIASSIALGLAGLLAGCDAGHSLTPLKGWAQFDAQVLRNPRPVLIEFGKDPCPTCDIQMAELDTLAPEFSNRVFFAKMIVAVGAGTTVEPEVRDKYNVFWVPTTVLFINGREVKRWELNHLAAEIRQTLNDELAKLPPPAPTTRTTTVRSNSLPPSRPPH
jgi:thioredoxin-like negative regulator of GroEL